MSFTQTEINMSINNIDIVDEDDTFIIEHFLNCDETSEDHIKDCRGIIRLKSDRTIVCKTYPFTPEIDFNSAEQAKISVESMLEKGATFYPSFEGTVLRLWSHEGKWYLSTHRKIDANKSRWGSAATFYKRFVDVLSFMQNVYQPLKDIFNEEMNEDIFNNYTSHLDPNMVYTYLLRTSNETRIVSRYDREYLLFLGAFDKTNNFNFVNPSSINAFLPIIPALNIQSYKDFANSLINNVMEITNIFLTQGVIAVSNQGECVKYMNPDYIFWSRVRGNEPILLQAYINKLKTGNPEEIQYFMSLYNDVDEFKQFEYIINDIKRNLLKTYISRYIHKKVIPTHPEQHQVLIKMYQKYLSDPKGNVLNMDWISAFVNNLTTTEIYNLYKQYKYRHEHFGNGNALKNEVISKVQNAYFKTSSNETMN